MTPASFYALLGSPFGRSKAYGPRFHAGQDYPWRVGTAIPAFAKGTVVAEGKTSAAGYYVVLLIGGRYFLFYHMREASPLSVGDDVEYGDTVGHVGVTGRTTGGHLHLAASTSLTPGYGTRVDPVPLVAKYLQASLASVGETPPILDSDESENTMTTRYLYTDDAGDGKVAYGIFGEQVPGGSRISRSVNTAEVWGAIWGTEDGAPWKEMTKAQWPVLIREAKVVNEAWVEQQRRIQSNGGTPLDVATFAKAFVAEMKLPGN